jgi:hypothetical protein
MKRKEWSKSEQKKKKTYNSEVEVNNGKKKF